MDFYGKWYRSNGGFPARYWYHFSVGLWRKDAMVTKLYGYWNIYYDGMFHFFNLWPFEIRWHKRPIGWWEWERHE
jgi:hypothetical protein